MTKLRATRAQVIAAAVIAALAIVVGVVGLYGLNARGSESGAQVLEDMRLQAILNTAGSGAVDAYVAAAKSEASTKARESGGGMSAVREAAAKAEEEARAKAEELGIGAVDLTEIDTEPMSAALDVLLAAQRAYFAEEASAQAAYAAQVAQNAPADTTLALENVTFGYEANRTVLKDVSFTVPQGSFVSLVGASGSGKSTIAALLAGRRTGYTGRVTMGGVPVQQLQQAARQRTLTVVPHDSTIFKGTVESNLRMAKPQATESELWAALEEVNLADFCRSQNGLISTIGISLNGKVEYALEGSVFVGGAVIQWVRDGLRMIQESRDAEYYAQKVPDNGGIYIVPAFTGLGAPRWDMYARGAIVGLTRGSNKAHIARATLEGIAYQVKDLLDAMQVDAESPISVLRVDGGASVSSFLMQFQADMLRVPIDRPKLVETTAFGAAFLAGIASGVWESVDDIALLRQSDRIFKPKMDAEQAKQYHDNWLRAVGRAEKWSQE